MKIKTFLTFLLAMAFAFSLSACKGDDDGSSSAPSSSIESETSSDSEIESGSSSDEDIYAPAGTLEDPFWLMEDVTAISLAAGQEVYYASRGSAQLTFEIANANVSVVYKDTTYTADNGVVSFDVIPEIGSITVFSVKNNTTEAIETTLTAIYPLGSRANPNILTGDRDTIDADIPQNGAIYYKWVATKDGAFTVSCDSPYNNISMQNGYVASDATLGEKSTSINCKAGDEILITVGTTDNSKQSFKFSYSI